LTAMRRLVVLLALVGGVVLAGTALGKTDRADVRGLCNSKGVDVYFWPQGHPAIPAINFPAFAPTHTEVYKPHDVTNTGQLAFLDPAQAGISGNQCSAATDTPLKLPAGTPSQTTTQTQKVRCALSVNAELWYGPWTQTKVRYVTRTIKVKGKKKKVRRAIRTTVRAGELMTAGATGASGAVVEVRMSATAGKSSLKWDTRACTAVDVSG
jgi:hypothetical protein